MNGDPDALPCGTQPSTLVMQVFEGAAPTAERFAHQARCPHCRASLASLQALRRDVGNVAAEPVGVPPHFARRVMARVRDVPNDIEVSVGPLGTTTLADGLVGRVARVAAMEVPRVAFALAEVGTTRAGSGATLSVRLVVDYGVALHAVAAAVRERVRRKVRRTTGISVERVDVVVEELSGCVPRPPAGYS